MKSTKIFEHRILLTCVALLIPEKQLLVLEAKNILVCEYGWYILFGAQNNR